MTLTTTDITFLEALQRASHKNRTESEKTCLTVAKSLISQDLLALFGVEDNNGTGAWFTNVYVEFVPFVNEQPAKDWQK